MNKRVFDSTYSGGHQNSIITGPSSGGGGGGSIVDFQQTIYSGSDITLSAANTWEDIGLSVTFDVNSTDDVVFLNFNYTTIRAGSITNLLYIGYKLNGGSRVLWSTSADNDGGAWDEVTICEKKTLWGLAPGSYTLNIEMHLVSSISGFSISGSNTGEATKPILSALVVQ